MTSNRRVNQSTRTFLLTRPGFIEVDRATALPSSFAGPMMMRNSLPVAPVQRFVIWRPELSGFDVVSEASRLRNWQAIFAQAFEVEFNCLRHVLPHLVDCFTGGDTTRHVRQVR